MPTRFTSIPASPQGVARMMRLGDRPLMLVSRHGLGDNIFLSACFSRLVDRFKRLLFCSSVNAYSTVFHESSLVTPVYCGGVNGAALGLDSAEGFVRHFETIGLDLGESEVLVYHFGLFDPPADYSHEMSFVKGRRIFLELFGEGPMAAVTPKYHIAPDNACQTFVNAVLDRWLPERDLVIIARYGHTDSDKNFGSACDDTLAFVRMLNHCYPARFRFVSLDYFPGDHAADGRELNLRSVYGFLPCDAAALVHMLARSVALVTVPTGPMVIGATLRHLKLLTLWKTMSPYHFLDPQFDGDPPTHAVVSDPRLADTSFMDAWSMEARAAVLRRWQIVVGPIAGVAIAEHLARLLDSV